ncbi:DegT/DnrJ/EryC1/StrS family aminotransferase [Pectobacterium parmentieri]|uniref:DegT/DnrJ/EryC1/StrS family aminotransferase n=1 Tax=Pectobacterium parmentieri TaxID=1905730 RepID=UPI0002E938C5|nr:DegT/DnrJ/EryC1/StrS family aminotransferase [Pectobacterium parmentieri]
MQKTMTLSHPTTIDSKNGQMLEEIRQSCRDNMHIRGDLPTGQADILVCLTLYNEPAPMLADTLAGLVRNQQELTATFANRPPNIIICILLDGTDSAHPSTVSLLASLGLQPMQTPRPDNQNNSLTLQVSEQSASHILRCCDQSGAVENVDQSMTLLLANKHHNAGKLDSHAWFFWGVGRVVKAEFAMQIDTGSVTESACLVQLLQHMWRDPHCGAVTTRVMLPVPTNANLSQNWQYADFIWEKVSDWAIGSALHYLEVVPGQCSMIRWSQFCENHGHAHAPLDAYLRGLIPQSLLERNLFLAEDRVLGFELTKHHKGSGVRYEQGAIVRSDPAPTFIELLRQRRRWVNSTLAARLHSLSRLPAVMTQSSLSPLRRCGITLSLLWGMLQFIAQFTMPAFIAILLATGVHPFVSHILPDAAPSLITAAAIGMALLFLVVWISILFMSRSTTLTNEGGTRYHVSAMLLLGALMGGAFAFTLLVAPIPSIGLMGVALFLLCLATSLHSLRYLRQFIRWMPLYLMLLPVFSLYLTTYSIANINDVSWGTKGLTTNQVGENKQKSWAATRDKVLFIWSAGSLTAALLFLLTFPNTQWMFIIQCASTFFCARIILSSSVSIGASITKRLRTLRKHTSMPFVDRVESPVSPSLPIVRPVFPPFESFASIIEESLTRGHVTNNGPYVRQLESRLTDYQSVPTRVFCNGEQALIALLLAADIRGKDVIVPSFTFAGTPHAVVIAGGNPVFADIKSRDCPLLDANDVLRRITANTTAIVAVDAYGYASDYTVLQHIARDHGLRLFIDSAPAFGTTVNGQRTGGFGDAQIFSFHATKSYNTIEGGCLCSHDAELIKRAEAIRNFGQDASGICVLPGLNGKMSELNAIIGLAQLPYLESQLTCRRQAASRLIAGMTSIPGLTPCLPPEGQSPVWQYLPIHVDAKRYGMNRNDLQHALHAQGIMVRCYYAPACHLMPAYAGKHQATLPQTEHLSACVLALPIYNDMTKEECELIITSLRALALSPIARHAVEGAHA